MNDRYLASELEGQVAEDRRITGLRFQCPERATRKGDMERRITPKKRINEPIGGTPIDISDMAMRPEPCGYQIPPCPLFLTTKVLFGHPYFNSGSMFLHGEKKKQAETL